MKFRKFSRMFDEAVARGFQKLFDKMIIAKDKKSGELFALFSSKNDVILNVHTRQKKVVVLDGPTHEQKN